MIPEHEVLEAEAAAFFGSEAALYFSSGFLANYALFAALPQRGDLIVYDALIHASAHDGMRASRAELAPAKHNDANAFEDAIRAWRAARRQGPAVDRGRKPLQHGRRPRAARRPRRRRRAP